MCNASFLSYKRGDTFIYGDSDEVFFLAIGGVNSIVRSVFNPFLMKRWYGMWYWRAYEELGSDMWFFIDNISIRMW